MVNASLGARLALNLGLLTDRSSSGPECEIERASGGAPSKHYHAWPRQDRYRATIGVSVKAGLLELHAGLAGGLVLYDSETFLLDGGDSQRMAPIVRCFFSGALDGGAFAGVL